MTKQETIQVLQSIEDRAIDFPNMTECDWVAIAAAKRHLTEEPVSEELKEAATQYGIDNFPSLCNGCKHVPVDAFKAGTKWQKAKDQKWIDDNHQQIFNEGYKNGSYAGRYDMYNRLLGAAATDRVVTHFLLAHSV